MLADRPGITPPLTFDEGPCQPVPFGPCSPSLNTFPCQLHIERIASACSLNHLHRRPL